MNGITFERLLQVVGSWGAGSGYGDGVVELLKKRYEPGFEYYVLHAFVDVPSFKPSDCAVIQYLKPVSDGEWVNEVPCCAYSWGGLIRRFKKRRTVELLLEEA